MDPDERECHPFDTHVGRQIRGHRRSLGLRQDELAARPNISRQQFHKYRTSGCRISASCLYDVARALTIPVSWFFSGVEEDQADALAVEVDAKIAGITAWPKASRWSKSSPLRGTAVRYSLVDHAKAIHQSQQSES